MEGSTLATFLVDLASVFTKIVSFLGDVFAMFIDEPILIFFCGLAFTGAVIGFAMRILYKR